MGTRVIFFIVIILLLFGCDKTDIRNKGTITIVEKSGAVFDLLLVVPPELENSVHKAMWFCTPSDNAGISYVENDLFGKDTLTFTQDRNARLTLLDPEGVTVEVYMFHNRQTSPQLFASLEIKE